MIQDIRKKIKTPRVQRILRTYRVNRIAIFGSAARGRMTSKSDIDFLVEFQPEADLFDQAGLKDDLSRVFKRPVDVLTRGGLNKRIRRLILKEAVDL